MPKDFEITKPMEEWSNGLYVTEFIAHGVLWDLKRSNGKDGRGNAEPFYTYLKPAHLQPWERRDHPTPPWLESYHIPTLPGTFEPDMAAIVIGMIKTQWERGEAAGRRNQQADFRKVIGVK